MEASISPSLYREKGKVWTWGEVAQELINYGRKYGAIPSNTTDPKSIWLTECKTVSSKTLKGNILPGAGWKNNGRGRTQGKKKRPVACGLTKGNQGIRKTLMDGQPTNELEIQEQPTKEGSFKAVPATSPPLEEPQKKGHDGKPLSSSAGG